MRRAIIERGQHLHQAFLRPLWAWGWVGVVGLVSGLTWIRDEFIPAEVAAKLKIIGLLPHWSFGWWGAAWIGALWLVLFEGSYREARELRGKLARAEFEAKALAERRNRPQLVGRFSQVIWGGANDRNLRGMILILSIRNTGTVPSIADGWAASIKNGDVEYPIDLTHFQGGVTWHPSEGGTIELPAREAIHRVTLTPIPIGGLASGYMFCSMSEQAHLALVPGSTIIVKFRDVAGETQEIAQVFEARSLRVRPDIPFANYNSD